MFVPIWLFFYKTLSGTNLWLSQFINGNLYEYIYSTQAINELATIREWKRTDSGRGAEWGAKQGGWGQKGTEQKDKLIFTPFHTCAAAWRGLRFCDPHRAGTHTKKNDKINTKRGEKKKSMHPHFIHETNFNAVRPQCVSFVHCTPAERACKAQLLQSMPPLWKAN